MPARQQGRRVDVDSLDSFDSLVDAGSGSMRGWLLQDLDLRDRTRQLLAMDPAGALLMGCQLKLDAVVHLRRGGALIFPNLPELPFDPYRGTLYSPEELYAGIEDAEYDETPDARIYAWSRTCSDELTYSIGRALHDHSIDQALDAALAAVRPIGVMGGHAIGRDEADYLGAVRLGHGLARAGLTVVTGGGPGAMEAANLGGYLSPYDDNVIAEAVQQLSAAPHFRPSVTAWARAAFSVRREWPDGGTSTGIPTWFYGHEPPNPFASAIAKYFQNSLREDTLLQHCTAGIVFLPGTAGTLQEIFQDACENYYATEATLAPMVLVDVQHWTADLPAWPLLSRLAESRPMQSAVHLVDSVDDAVTLLAG